ncbi:transcriptional regulator, HxlR family [Desulfatibacillum aliphaticivorans]|uniref:Transcriptional regulator, HxlR family n=1 Tax=Desulfatibacillum aliphaticivorans TaxID=218208 RepID=B8FMJ2_DESAL|nr:helix-turn-helix domain-containing protein [Desulfatibacillum aliphaticivorans]ACL01859.1 transcriptional regulator, HxlR family [Desulfatibacillum aliphaticivorans]
MKKNKDHRTCSVGRVLEILGDRWTFMILREAFFGVRYYDQFQANLGIASNILSDRLKSLVSNGILNKRKDPEDARRVVYRFSQKGVELYSVTLALMRWGDKWLSGEEGPPLRLHHKTCGHDLEPMMCCAHCREEIRAFDVSYESGPGLDKSEDEEAD